MGAYVKLDAYHFDDNDREIRHEAATLDEGPPRRFVFRW